MRWLLIVLAILALIIVYSYVTVSNGPIEPVGRLAFVKFANPDMYTGNPHSQLVAKYIKEHGSNTGLVVHFAGGPEYDSYYEGNVLIINVGFIDTQGKGSADLSEINLMDSLKVSLFGVPEGRYNYLCDGKTYTTYDSMMNHVKDVAQKNGDYGKIPMFWHGTVRTGNPIITQGCGYPLYFQILTNYYGIIPAYVYMISGMIFPYLYNPYRNFEVSNASELQKYYNTGAMDFNY